MRSGAVVPRMLVATVLLVSPAAVLAEDEDENPGRGVARISVINGDVSVRRGDSGDWVAGAVNAPLVVQDTVATGPNSRAEVQFDSENVIRLGSNAEVRLSELENRRYQIQVARGPVEFSVLRDSDADVDLSTPAVSVRPSRRGRYRINVFDGQTEVTVRSGEVEVYTPRGVERVTSGNAILMRNADSGPEFQTISAARPDEFDRWTEDRDRKLERAASSYRYVSPSIYGVDDLDDHGRWVYDAPYGWVWVPSAGPGWAPYRHGRWVWQDWYGWTWVSYDPWGWAPYHYGRWYHGHHGWCWYPGDIRGRHYWRPALVAFFGFGGGGVHVGFGFGRVGWVPLAPYEPYYPWYGRRYYGGYRGGYVDRSVNITNVNITNVYRNARVRDGVSGMDASSFGRGGRNIVRVGDGDIRQAGLVRGQLPVAPDRGSLRFADREVRNAPRATDNNNVRFYSRRQAAPVDRVPFAEQQRSFQRASQGGATGGAAQQVRTGGTDSDRGWRRGGERSGSPNANSVRSERPGNAEGGRTWRRVGEPAHQSSAPAGVSQSEPASREAPADRGRTWRRFGEPTRLDAPVTRPSETSPGTGERVGRGETERSRTWQRFGEPGAARPAEPVRRQRQTAEPRRTEQFQPVERGGSDGGRGAGRNYEARPSRSEPSVRVAPQVMRERSAAPSRSVERQSSGGGGGGGRERGNSGNRGDGGSRGGGRTR
ncbi:MAG TPA: FecR family protein [Bryobacteraceae bacterium]|nr:FecR family protein [Bryobacteraceae bacterium]